MSAVTRGGQKRAPYPMELELTGRCELPAVGAGAELWASARGAGVLHHCTVSSHHFLKTLKKINKLGRRAWLFLKCTSTTIYYNTVFFTDTEFKSLKVSLDALCL